MPNPGKQNTGYKVQEIPLTIRDHLDPDKHWIGESLGVPTQTEIAATVGNTSSPGDSPFVARADHLHKLGTAVVKASNLDVLIRRRDSRSPAQNFAAGATTQTMTGGIVNIENQGTAEGSISNSGGSYTVPVSGSYAITFLLNTSPALVPVTCKLVITVVGQCGIRLPGTGNTSQTVSLISFMNSGTDSVQFFVDNSAGAATVTAIPEIQIVRIAYAI